MSASQFLKSSNGLLGFNYSQSVAGKGVNAASGGSISAARTLTLNDSGGTFSLVQGAGAFAITLPLAANAQGMSVTLRLLTAAAADITVSNGQAQINGFSSVNNVAASQAGRTTITVAGGAAAVGDQVLLSCDGVGWNVIAFSSAAAGITFA